MSSWWMIRRRKRIQGLGDRLDITLSRKRMEYMKRDPVIVIRSFFSKQT
jgi:hypothetical protein